MANAKVTDYGTITNFDPMNPYGNMIDLWCVAICDRETDEVESEEHYTKETEFLGALRYTYGRETFAECAYDGWCNVAYDMEHYSCECTYHTAYVYDNEEE